MSNEAIAEHILHIVHKYDQDWNNAIDAHNRKSSLVGMQALAGVEDIKFPQPPTKPPATVLLDRIKATLEHYNEQTN